VIALVTLDGVPYRALVDADGDVELQVAPLDRWGEPLDWQHLAEARLEHGELVVGEAYAIGEEVEEALRVAIVLASR
jgi:fermentation-respiration switch protein FrsA (DUF1100 family)